jgi:hypothetical protein
MIEETLQPETLIGFENIYNWKIVPFGLLQVDAYWDDLNKEIKSRNGKFLYAGEYKVGEFCKSAKQGFELVRNDLLDKLNRCGEGFEIILRVQPVDVDPFYKIEVENKKLKYGVYCYVLYSLVKNPAWCDTRDGIIEVK